MSGLQGPAVLKKRVIATPPILYSARGRVATRRDDGRALIPTAGEGRA
jgi:hypothetical protein